MIRLILLPSSQNCVARTGDPYTNSKVTPVRYCGGRYVRNYTATAWGPKPGAMKYDGCR